MEMSRDYVPHPKKDGVYYSVVSYPGEMGSWTYSRERADHIKRRMESGELGGSWRTEITEVPCKVCAICPDPDPQACSAFIESQKKVAESYSKYGSY